MWLNKWVHKLFLQCRPRSFFNLKPVSVIVYQFQTVRFIQMMSLTFGLFTQVSGSGPLGPLVSVTCHLSQGLTLLHSEQSELHRVLAVLSAKRVNVVGQPLLLAETVCHSLGSLTSFPDCCPQRNGFLLRLSMWFFILPRISTGNRIT